jgi:ribonuclease R
MYVEGLVHITELGGEYFKFDEARQELRGERSGIRYAIGARVRVQVSRVDLDGRRIDFRLVQEGDALAPRGAGERSSAKGGAKKAEKPARAPRDEGDAPQKAHKQAHKQARGAAQGAPAGGRKSRQQAALLTKAPERSGKGKSRRG